MKPKAFTPDEAKMADSRYIPTVRLADPKAILAAIHFGWKMFKLALRMDPRVTKVIVVLVNGEPARIGENYRLGTFTFTQANRACDCQTCMMTDYLNLAAYSVGRMMGWEGFEKEEAMKQIVLAAEAMSGLWKPQNPL